jgi:DNA-binding MarR family transcriptional regulator
MTGKASRPRSSAASAKLKPGTVFGLLDRVARRLRELHRASMDRCGLPPSGYSIVQALWAQDEQPPAALAVHAHCTRATMTSLLDTLEKRGLITRRPHPTDRRSLLVALTPKGRDIRKKTPDLDRVFGCCCSGLSPREFAALHALLEKLYQSLDPPAGGCACPGKERS